MLNSDSAHRGAPRDPGSAIHVDTSLPANLSYSGKSFISVALLPMGSFGRNLRRDREMRGISLEEIAQHTKISTRLLEAIEADRFDLLPGGVFTRSFVLHCARYLGLDEAQVGAEYDLLVGAPKPVDIREVAEQRERLAAAALPADSAAAAQPGRQRAAVVLFALLLILGSYALREWWWPSRAGASGPSPRPSAASEARPAAPSGTVPASGLPGLVTTAATVSPTASANTVAAFPGAKLRLQVDTIDPSWIVAYADGRKIWEAQMLARETRALAAESYIRLRVGNAGGVVLTLNGETQPPLGLKGEVKTVSFTLADLKKQ